jgi:hypothetical protein
LTLQLPADRHSHAPVANLSCQQIAQHQHRRREANIMPSNQPILFRPPAVSNPVPMLVPAPEPALVSILAATTPVSASVLAPHLALLPAVQPVSLLATVPAPVPTPALAPASIPATLPLARRPFNLHAINVHSLGNMDIVCPDCYAYHWKAEKLSTSTIANPKFGICCLQGKIKLHLLPDPPTELKDLYERRDPNSAHFLTLIRRYNNSFAMTSAGAITDDTINNGFGPWIYRIRGKLWHKAGGLLPLDGEQPLFAQLYIYDSQEK